MCVRVFRVGTTYIRVAARALLIRLYFAAVILYILEGIIIGVYI